MDPDPHHVMKSPVEIIPDLSHVHPGAVKNEKTSMNFKIFHFLRLGIYSRREGEGGNITHIQMELFPLNCVLFHPL